MTTLNCNDKHVLLLVALNYGMNRKFVDRPEYHIFYDMGAGNTVATLASFTQSSSIGKSKPIDIKILATSSDQTLGGTEVDVRIREIMLKAFESEHKSKTAHPIRENMRAMAKLLKEASRIKEHS